MTNEVSDLCLGKPLLRSLSVSASIGEALSALKRSSKNYLSLWSCDHDDCLCIGKVCMVDIICFLCKQDNLTSPAAALQSPVSVLLPKAAGIVRHLQPPMLVFRLLEAIDLILKGAQNLVIPIENRRSWNNSRKNLTAIATLSAGKLMAYIDCGGPPEDLVRPVKEKQEERNLEAFLKLMEEEVGNLSSSDEEFGIGKSGRIGGYSTRMAKIDEICNIQALKSYYLISSSNLETQRIEDNLLNCCNIKVENSEMQKQCNQDTIFKSCFGLFLDLILRFAWLSTLAMAF